LAVSRPRRDRALRFYTVTAAIPDGLYRLTSNEFPLTRVIAEKYRPMRLNGFIFLPIMFLSGCNKELETTCKNVKGTLAGNSDPLPLGSPKEEGALYVYFYKMKRKYMKGNRLLFILALFLNATSCSKQSSTTLTSDCIERLMPKHTESTLTGNQLDSIKTLFGKNNLSIDQLQFIQFTPNIYSDQEQVWANLFLNGLPVFNYNEVFIFNHAIFDTAYLYTGTASSNDPTGHQTLAYLRTAFFKHVSESVIYAPVGKPFVPSSSTYLDSCLAVTLGYVDAVYFPGNTIPWGTLKKVWSIKPLHSSYPNVFVEDDSGLAWGVPVYIP
jgi:hypothetical protein